MGKYSISEVAQILNISTNKIRFYEKKGLILPDRKAGSSYRRFSGEDILLLKTILLYREIGLSVDSIKSILKNSNRENYLEHFNTQWKLINDEIHRLNIVRNSIEKVIDIIYENTNIESIKKYLIETISPSNEITKVKSNWVDKWDFNNWAKSYDQDVENNKGYLKIYKNYNLILDRVYEIFKECKITGPKIIEIGVGTGNLSSKFLVDNFDITGIDQSREMLNIAKEKYPKLRVRLGEFLKIPYDNYTFDFIVSTYAFHHLNNSEKIVAIEEMIRVLKPSGVIIIGDLMFQNQLAEEELIKTLSPKELEEVKDEYYSYIDMLTQEFERYNKKLYYEKIDRLNYIIKVY